MGLILAAALFSVLVSVLLKLMPRHRIDVAQAVTWNYLVAVVLCLWLFDPPLQQLGSPQTPWLVLLLLGLILPSLFLVLAISVRRAGIVRTDIAQRLSLLLSLAAAFVFFKEPAGIWKLAGLALGLVAIAAIVSRPGNAGTAEKRSLLVLLTVWVGFAAVDVLLKLVARAGIPFAATLAASFSLAFGLMLATRLWCHFSGKSRLDARSFGAGLLLGALNFGNIICYVRAHQALPDNPAVVFATMNIGVVVLGTLTGVFVFGEPTSRWNRIGIALAIAAIVLIAMAPRV